MHFVYVLTSQKDPAQHYVGITENIDEKLAHLFERYLKKGSGHAFFKKNFI